MPACECGTRIIFAQTPAGKAMPVEEDSADKPGGTLAVWRRDGGLYCRVLKKGEEPAAGEHRGTSHYATCPNAAKFRKRR